MCSQITCTKACFALNLYNVETETDKHYFHYLSEQNVLIQIATYIYYFSGIQNHH